MDGMQPKKCCSIKRKKTKRSQVSDEVQQVEGEETSEEVEVASAKQSSKKRRHDGINTLLWFGHYFCSAANVCCLCNTLLGHPKC